MAIDEKPSSFESILQEEGESANAGNDDDNGGWKKVTYVKRNRKSSLKPSDSVNNSDKSIPDGSAGDKSEVFPPVEEQAEESRRRDLEAEKDVIVAAGPVTKPKQRWADYEDDSDVEESGGVENVIVEEKKSKQKKPKKVTVAEAASKIDVSELAAFLLDVSTMYETDVKIQLMRFADFFGRAFSSVGAAQFPWTKMFKESTVAKMTDIPLSHIPEDVYKTSVEWLNQRPFDALGFLALWSIDNILTDLESQQGVGKASKKMVQHASPKAQVAMFVVLAMILRRKPDVMISLLLQLKKDPKYEGQDMLSVIVWAIAQASQGELAVGLYLWVHYLLPMVSGKSICDPHSRDLVLQLVESILSVPKARNILINCSVRKGERLVPPSALELLMRLTFPAPSARTKETEGFEAVYPTLKEVALAYPPGSKAMKQVTQQILNVSIKAAEENIPELSNEATSIFIWCLTQNPDCYKQWETSYLDNLEASVAVLRRLSDEWKEHSVKDSLLDSMKATLKSFRQKNENALASGEYASKKESLKDADKYCRVLLRRMSPGHHVWLKSVVVASIAMGVGAVMGAVMVSLKVGLWD